ncbi:MAG: hypothetical protein KFB96_12430 [Thiocapsa sp.]|uniref:hypothetical protein n=1 Tax=Thiocapsa sp. TaxID=2024551 RepID=UPI001BCAE74A|nr:hypothetical protein [Thiocapsa sp.]QVL51126.1 MAG: hypothetical protein KFB96_12430 [Thiocapsa sp.]
MNLDPAVVGITRPASLLTSVIVKAIKPPHAAGGDGRRLQAEFPEQVVFRGPLRFLNVINIKPRPVRYAMFLDGIGPGGFQSCWSRRGLKY